MSHKRDRFRVRRIRTFPFLPTPLTTPSLTFRLWPSENQIVGVGRRSGRINQSQCSFPRFVIGLVFLHLLTTRTIWFSLDNKRNVSDGVVNGIGTLFSQDHKLYASDYDSDSDYVASGNQPWGNKFWKKIARHLWKFVWFWFSPFRSSLEYPLPLGISNLIYNCTSISYLSISRDRSG